jgi:hypothetical protein
MRPLRQPRAIAFSIVPPSNAAMQSIDGTTLLCQISSGIGKSTDGLML